MADDETTHPGKNSSSGNSSAENPSAENPSPIVSSSPEEQQPPRPPAAAAAADNARSSQQGGETADTPPSAQTEDPETQQQTQGIPPPPQGIAISEKRKETFVQSIRSDVLRGKRSIPGFLRSRIITGFFVVIPVFLSLWVAAFLYSKLTQWAVRISREYFPQFHQATDDFWMEQGIRVISLLLILVLLFIAGQLMRLAIGRKLISLMQKLFLKLPIINFIYSTCKQIGDALWSSKEGNMFRQVVLFEYPMKGCYAIGFLTNENKRDFEVTQKLNAPMLSVFMPTTPNPTSGFLMFIPKENCIFLNMSVPDAMRLIVSCGAVTPPVPDPHGAAAEKLSQASPGKNPGVPEKTGKATAGQSEKV